MTSGLEHAVERVLRWSEKYTKTDMVYLMGAGFWTNLNFAIVSIFALLLSVAFANWLPSEVYGMYQYLLSLSSILVAFCLTGMNIAVTQSVARGYEGDLRAAVRAQLRWSIVPLLIGFACVGYYLINGNTTLATGFLIVALFAPLTNVFNTYNAFLQGRREFKRIFMYTTATNLLYYALIFPAVFFFRNAIVLIFVNLAVNALAIMYFYFRTVRTTPPNDRTDPGTISYGKHLSVMNTIGTVAAQLDTVLVFHFLGPVQLALYSFASLIPERLSSLFKFATTAALPKFSNQTREEIRRHLISKAVRGAAAGAVMALAYIVLAPTFFHLLFPRYEGAVFFTQVYSLVIITVAANIPAAAIVAVRLNRELYLFNILTPILLLVLQVALLLSFGILGILAARVISNVINIVFAIYLVFFPFSVKKSGA